MQFTMDPKYIEAINRGELRRDWKAIARRLEAAEGHWQQVWVTKRYDSGLKQEVEERLRAVGCRAQVVVGVPRNQNPLVVPDRVVFARIPRSRRAPNGWLF